MKVLFILIFPMLAISAPLKVVIDPGHGGVDSGAVKGHIREADVVLKISNHLIDSLNQDPNFVVLATRRGDKTVSLKERVDKTKHFKADLFLSIHANSHQSPKARGAEFYLQTRVPIDEEVLFLANRENQNAMISKKTTNQSDLQTILEDLDRTNALHESLKLAKLFTIKWKSDRGEYPAHVKQGPFYVLAEQSIPSLLVEVGFLSHHSEGRWLAKPHAQKIIAEIIYKTLTQYKERLDKNGPVQHIDSHANR